MVSKLLTLICSLQKSFSLSLVHYYFTWKCQQSFGVGDKSVASVFCSQAIVLLERKLCLKFVFNLWHFSGARFTINKLFYDQLIFVLAFLSLVCRWSCQKILWFLNLSFKISNSVYGRVDVSINVWILWKIFFFKIQNWLLAVKILIF